MENYLGEFDTDYGKNYTKEQWAMEFIETYGQIDGEHHKAWVLDQVARVLNDTPIIVKEARWGEENNIKITDIRFKTGEPSQKYLEWVDSMLGDEDEIFGREYEYYEGCAP